MEKRTLPLLVLGLLLLSAPARASETAPWSVSFYRGHTSFTKFMDLVRLRSDYRPSYIYTLTLGREFARRDDRVAWEWEAHLAKHSGMQHHLEAGAIVIVRWLDFPWNERVATTAAIGSGPSYAFRKPAVEAAQHDQVSKLLNHLMVELTFAHPGHPEWQLMARIHHRSGAGGTIHGVSGGSNFAAFGLRRRF